MWFYVILFLFCVIMLIVNDKVRYVDKKHITIFTLIVLIIVSGTRYYLGGTDYYVYKSVYDSLPTLTEFITNFPNLHYSYLTYGFETGYLFSNSFIKSLGFNFYGFTLFHSIFFYISMYVGLKKYSWNFNLLVIVFLYKLFFYNTFISMRQSITLGIFFLSLKYIERNQPIKYFISILIATQFHSVAWVLMLVYFIKYLKISYKNIIALNIIFIPTILISNLNVLAPLNFIVDWFSNPIVASKASNLLSGGELSSSVSLLHTLEYFFLMGLLIYFYEKIVDEYPESKFVVKIFLLLLPIFTLFRNYEMLTRIKDYFVLTYAILIDYFIRIDIKTPKAYFLIPTVAICAFGFFRFIILFDNGGMIPYESFLFKGVSIFR